LYFNFGNAHTGVRQEVRRKEAVDTRLPGGEAGYRLCDHKQIYETNCTHFTLIEKPGTFKVDGKCL